MRQTLPLKDGVIGLADDTIFKYCHKLNNVDPVEGVHETTIAALLMEEWRIDMNEEIVAINRILATTPAGTYQVAGGKAREIRTWIRSVLAKLVHYKTEHRRILNEAATTIHLVLPRDIL